MRADVRLECIRPVELFLAEQAGELLSLRTLTAKAEASLRSKCTSGRASRGHLEPSPDRPTPRPGLEAAV